MFKRMKLILFFYFLWRWYIEGCPFELFINLYFGELMY